MKKLLFTLAFLITGITYAQDSTTVKVEAPKIVSKLEFGKSLDVNDVTLKFVEVVQDSRCPKNVSCIWAGEIIVKVDVIKNEKKLEQRIITLKPANQLKTILGNIFQSEDLSISGFNVLPYPISGNKIKNEDYYIELDVRH